MSSTIIDVDTAKLVGLQIDTLQKVRSGQITLGQWERFNNLSTDDREVRFGTKTESVPTAGSSHKFSLFLSLGIVTVPNTYCHKNAIAVFRQRYQKIILINDNISDEHFANPTRILKPGDRFRVRVFRQICRKCTTSNERMDFLRNEGAVFLGFQGLAVVAEQMRSKLPRGKIYTSFDEKERLWQDPGGAHNVPQLTVYAGSRDDYSLALMFFEAVWNCDYTFLCFNDVE